MIEEYLLNNHRNNFLEILQSTDDKHYSININFVELFENDPSLGNNILKNAETTLKALKDRIFQVQNRILAESNLSNLTPKRNIHVRVYCLPVCPELHRNVFPKNKSIDQFLQITGVVVRVTGTKMLEFQRPYMCTKCKYIETVEASFEQKHIIIPPKKCANPESCQGKKFVSPEDLSMNNCKDYQEIKIQELTSKLGVGSMPSSMWVTLADDLVDVCKPGDEVTICGIVKRRWGPLVSGKRVEVELVFKANHIQINNNQVSPALITAEVKNQFVIFWEKYKNRPLDGRDIILKSFCPKLYGMYLVKLAMAVILAGGSHCNQGNELGIQKRSEAHILLVGDPGTGKSQLLCYAAKIIPRSVLTTGVGTTSAGLTVAALMEDGQWQLEGGALVLADGGICCIDEFNSMKPHDRTSIHEAMEQQTISVAKASIVCKLKTRCSIIAATNPKGGRLDTYKSLSLNLTLPSPLLSRFDIILMLKDTSNDKWDTLVAEHILSGKGIDAININLTLWPQEKLQKYFALIRNMHPTLNPVTRKILSTYYQAQRRSVSRNKAMTTVRLLDSLVRLSQGHARLMFHTEVQIMDTLYAILLIENSMNGESRVLSLDCIDVQSDFSSDQTQTYADLEKSILSQLGLNDILLDKCEDESVFNSSDIITSTPLENSSNESNKRKHKFTESIQETKILKSIDSDVLQTLEQAPNVHDNSIEVDVPCNSKITMSQFRKAFSFKPRKLTRLPSKDIFVDTSEPAQPVVQENISTDLELPISDNQKAAESMFETQEEDYDCLNFDL